MFSISAEQLSVLLVKRPDAEPEPYPGRWALPGGFVDVTQDATLQDCAMRKLHVKTGVDAPYLEQLGSWGGATRDPRGWSCTHAYFALMAAPAISAKDEGSSPSEWVPVETALRRRLAFDHNAILEAAVERLRSKVEYTSLPAFLLPVPFTLPQLQRSYETVLGRALDKSAFRKRMLDADYLEEAGMLTTDQGRPAMGYRVRNRERAVVFPRGFKSGEAPG
ncbi:NUDIX domain-containing protein [Hydrogenophaga sp. 5NK40-0174]|uniref:NUDIX hydrolase n=1 Tax=Hydrogenophaga sp. 5NK40-0174 TaxID=3127649 RepID=UPI003342B09C